RLDSSQGAGQRRRRKLLDNGSGERRALQTTEVAEHADEPTQRRLRASNFLDAQLSRFRRGERRPGQRDASVVDLLDRQRSGGEVDLLGYAGSQCLLELGVASQRAVAEAALLQRGASCFVLGSQTVADAATQLGV